MFWAEDDERSVTTESDSIPTTSSDRSSINETVTINANPRGPRRVKRRRKRSLVRLTAKISHDYSLSKPKGYAMGPNPPPICVFQTLKYATIPL
ncbi:hypothetical protein HAHE_01720 [Haloferula helveola]|uniref:Uncharacterized protein n=1 Tax=Haloferula helveola TaxID=490095 RepID=A0ABM7REZ3_9BACT|nr:hypothetical protein HAHE_01720 [Haloferula helveola]